MAKNAKTAIAESTPEQPAAGSTAVAETNGKALSSSRKTECAVSREQFRKGAKPQMVTIGGIPQVASVKEFSTGSLGWYLNGKTVIEVDGVPVQVQIGLNLTIIGSKELPA